MLFNKNCVAFAASSAKNAGITALFNSPICTSATFNNLRTLSIALKMDEKNKIAKSAIEPLAWLLSYHLTALSETENDAKYKDKIPKILDILFEGKESDFIVGIRKKASR